MRVDFAGGTLDMPPLYIFHHPAWTINATISLYAKVRIEKSSVYEIVSVDQGVETTFKKYADNLEIKYPALKLFLRSLKVLNTGPIKIVAESEAPAHAGLAGSSAMLIALNAALLRYAGIKLSKQRFIEYVKSVETCLLRVPTGYQDFWSAVYGGLNAYQVALDGEVRKMPLGLSDFVHELERQMIVVYVGRPRFSGANNWSLFKQNIDCDKKTVSFFDELATNSVAMLDAFKSQKVSEVVKVLSLDWKVRKNMLPSMSTPEIEGLEKVVVGAGARGFRVCGAGGGGCALLFAVAEKRGGVLKAIEELGMRVLDIKIVKNGVRVWEE